MNKIEYRKYLENKYNLKEKSKTYNNTTNGIYDDYTAYDALITVLENLSGVGLIFKGAANLAHNFNYIRETGLTRDLDFACRENLEHIITEIIKRIENINSKYYKISIKDIKDLIISSNNMGGKRIELISNIKDTKN